MAKRQKRKRGMSQCQVPYRQHRIDPVAATVVGIVAAAEVAAVAAIAAADEVVGYDGAAGTAVALAPERGMTQIWDWG